MVATTPRLPDAAVRAFLPFAVVGAMWRFTLFCSAVMPAKGFVNWNVLARPL